MTAEPQPIGQLLDALGVTALLQEGDMPVDALVLIKIIKANGRVAVVHASSEAVDWITTLGMLQAAVEAEKRSHEELLGEDD